jgi:hypothetical protein
MPIDEKPARPRLSVPSSNVPHKTLSRAEAGATLYPTTPSAPSTGDKSLTIDKVEGGVIYGHVAIPVRSPEKYQRFKLARENDRPLEFEGIELAKVAERSQSTRTAGAAMVTRAALYRTRGGKFVSEFSKFEAEPMYPNPSAPRPVEFAKVAVFDSQDVAMQWFRVGGRFTMKLWEQLGGQESEFIE